MVLAALAFCVGIAIGLRYSLLALLPPIIGILCLHVAIDGAIAARVASAVICAVCVQGGYMIGLTARDLVQQILSRLSASFRST